MMREMEDDPVEAIDMGFLAPDTGVKHVSFRFVEMALTNIEQQRLMDKVTHNSLER